MNNKKKYERKRITLASGSEEGVGWSLKLEAYPTSKVFTGYFDIRGARK